MDSSYQNLSNNVLFAWFRAGPRFDIVFGNDVIMMLFLIFGFQNVHILWYIMGLSSVTPRVAQEIIKSGITFCAKSPTLGDIDLSNRPEDIEVEIFVAQLN